MTARVGQRRWLYLLALWVSVWVAVSLGAAATGRVRSAESRSAALRARAFDAAYNLDHDLAISLLTRAASTDPDEPANYRSLATITWLNALFKRGTVTVDDYLGRLTPKDIAERRISSEQAAAFRDYVQKAMSLAEKRLAANPNDVQANYDLGAALGLQASYVATVEGKVRSAFGPARRAYNLHEKVLALDKRRTDAGVVVGTYRYVVAMLPATVRWIAYVAGFGGGKERGIAFIEQAARDDSEAQVEAKFALVLLYNREKRYADALRVLRDLQQRFPRNRLLWLESGATALRAGRPAEAVAELEHGMAMLAADDRPRMFGEEALWRYKRGTALAATGEEKRAREDLAAAATGEARDWIHGRAHLELGKLADLEGNRAVAIVQYDRAIAACTAGSDRVGLAQARALKRKPFSERPAPRPGM
jgi:tetratricopeptide (TPR) repeat protein